MIVGHEFYHHFETVASVINRRFIFLALESRIIQGIQPHLMAGKTFTCTLTMTFLPNSSDSLRAGKVDDEPVGNPSFLDVILQQPLICLCD